jgi:ApaG protein
MSSSPQFIEPVGLKVTVDRVAHQPDADAPPSRPFCFVYYISIWNDTEETVTIRGRKWVVTNARGEVTAVEGEGVVGMTPEIQPGDKFSYNSYHLLDTPTGQAEGSYIGIDSGGRKVLTRIPLFTLSAEKPHG